LKNILNKEAADNAVNVKFDEKQVIISLTNFVLNCRLIEGKYPNYAAVIPAQNPNVLQINKMDFYQKLRRVAYFADPSNGLVKLEMSGSSLSIKAQNLDSDSKAAEELNCNYEGDDDMKIGFKSKFLLTILDNINSEDVSIQMSDPSRAGIIVPVDKPDENEDVLMLLMPMMI
jgi:DNA polymerase-3 subunit beta